MLFLINFTMRVVYAVMVIIVTIKCIYRLHGAKKVTRRRGRNRADVLLVVARNVHSCRPKATVEAR